MVWDIILALLFALLFGVAVVEFFIIKGFVKHSDSPRKHSHLTGREVEEIRRKLSSIGIQAITVDDVFNLIMTIRDTHLGTYVDEDPYIPADPYDDIDARR